MRISVSRTGIATAAVIAVAVGCSRFPVIGKPDEPPGVTEQTLMHTLGSTPGTHPIAAFLAAARAGDSTFLTIPESGNRVHVTAERVYFAASGRYCRRYLVTSTNSATTTTAGLACKSAKGDWQLESLIVNPNSVNAP